MKRYRIILGEPLSRKFDQELQNWEDTIDFIMKISDSDPELHINSWTPKRASLRELIEFLISKIWEFGFLVRFVVDYNEDHYGKVSETPRMYLISQADYLKTKDALWAVENKNLLERFLEKGSMDSITYLVHDYNERYKR